MISIAAPALHDCTPAAEPPRTSHIAMLPPEILLEIFDYCVASDPRITGTLCQVSWQWKTLTTNAPHLWQNIVLNDSNIRQSERIAALWIERSKSLKYDLQLNMTDTDYILPLLHPLIPTIHRWRSFRLIVDKPDEANGKVRFDEDIPIDDLQFGPDSLTHLHLFLHDYEQDDLDEEEPRINISPISPEYLMSFALNIWVSRIPSPSILPPLRFAHITIAEGGSLGLHCDAKTVLEFLTACPDLESFFFSGWPHDGSVVGQLPQVNLPNLVTLHLKSTCFARSILSSVITPRLERLYLSHLNVDFQLTDQDSYHDPGDSEDEANDFSQSPSSDRATGMGLRKLLNRCNPPIRILEMDFCDMRTKDFNYVFDRLPLLEDFFIVASDMSNKVINLLRPTVPLKHGDGVQIRLPRLHRLRLLNCQRLTGQAIVDSLTERVRWTDHVGYNGHTLQEVTIHNCEGFSPWDRLSLSAILQTRLTPAS